jgi:hypothetical protein
MEITPSELRRLFYDFHRLSFAGIVSTRPLILLRFPPARCAVTTTKGRLCDKLSFLDPTGRHITVLAEYGAATPGSEDRRGAGHKSDPLSGQ